MTYQDRIRAKYAIQQMANQFGKSETEVRAAMKEALDDAWERSRGDPELRAAWDRYFPDGRKPTVDEFIVHLANLH